MLNPVLLQVVPLMPPNCYASEHFYGLRQDILYIILARDPLWFMRRPLRPISSHRLHGAIAVSSAAAMEHWMFAW